MREIILSESMSHVTYTGINSLHCQKRKQPYGVLEKNTTIKKKSAVQEDPRISSKRYKKKEPL